MLLFILTYLLNYIDWNYDFINYELKMHRGDKPLDKNTFVSKGKNTPFDGWLCYGWPVMTLVNGKIVYKK